jgi:hypothetical protein
MFKLIYGALLLLFSSAAFLFSKEKDEPACKHSLTGIVKALTDSTGFHFYIESPDHQVYFPYIEKKTVVLASGASVKVCYDTIGNFHNAPLIRINHVSILP